MKERIHDFFLGQSATYIDILSQVLFSLITIVVGLVAIKVLKYIIKKAVRSSKVLSERKMNTMSTVSFSFVKYFVYFMIVCQVLSIFHVNITSFIVPASILSVAIGFGAQSLVQDVITGLFILLEDQFGVGDVVTIDGKTGTVESIGIRATALRSADGDVHIVPNGQIKVVTNMSKGFNRAVVDVGISYEDDVDSALKIFEDEAKHIETVVPGLLHTPSVLGITSFSESSVIIRIVADCEIGTNWQVEREIRRLMKQRLDKEGILMPYIKHTVEQR